MRFLSRLAVVFYVSVIMVLGVLVVLYASHGIPKFLEVSFQDSVRLMGVVYYDRNVRTLVGLVGVLILLVNYFFMKAISDDREMERTIAFDNPTGRVSVSLAALEDLTRRVIAQVPEVKEVRTTIRAGKKGLEVEARLVLRADVNIPEMTAQLQNLVTHKVQDTIGIEETPTVRIHISKIIPSQKKERAKAQKSEDESATVPFQGYRA